MKSLVKRLKEEKELVALPSQSFGGLLKRKSNKVDAG